MDFLTIVDVPSEQAPTKWVKRYCSEYPCLSKHFNRVSVVLSAPKSSSSMSYRGKENESLQCNNAGPSNSYI